MNSNIHAVVLAAGAARRFGSTKQLTDMNGKPLVRHALDTACQVFRERVTLVLGHDWQAVYEACALPQGFMVINEQHAEGLGTSIARAVRAVRHAADAIVIVLADQPLVAAEHLGAICAAWSREANEIVATGYCGTSGAPALFGPAAYDALTALRGDQGARQLFADQRFTLRTVACEAAAVDIDRPEDLQNLR